MNHVMHTKDRVAILQMETTMAVLGDHQRYPAEQSDVFGPCRDASFNHQLNLRARMAYWVTTGEGTTLVSRASSESAARAEAEKRDLVIDEITPISAEVTPAELEKYEQLTVSPLLAFKLFCLTAGQVSSLLACLGCIPLTISMLGVADDSSNTIEVSFMALIAGALAFCTFASLYIVYSHVKQQLKA